MRYTSFSRVALPLIAGIGAGTAIGYVVGGMGAKPAIKVFLANGIVPPVVPAGTLYDIYYEGFPPRTQLVSARNASVAGGDIVNLGTTGADGRLTIKGVTAVGPAGNYYLNAFDAPTGKYSAVYTLIVT